MTSIYSLSPELLTLIFDQLHNGMRPFSTLHNLNLVCQSFHRIASRLLLRGIRIRFTVSDTDVDSEYAALIRFLNKNEDIRAHIRRIFVLVDGRHVRTAGLRARCFTEDALIELLPKLPNLNYINVVLTGSWDRPEHLPAHSTLFTAVARLSQNVMLNVNGYTHTPNSHLLDDIECLDSLDVTLFDTPITNRNGEPIFDGTPSRDVSQLIQHNRNLKHLGICPGGSHVERVTRYPNFLFKDEQIHALENLAVSMPGSLESLSLKGDLHFTPAAWSLWSHIWVNIQTLSIAGSVGRQIVSNFDGSFVSLKSLSLNPYPPSRFNPPQLGVDPFAEGYGFWPDMEDFISSKVLTRISLAGCPPGTIYALENSTSTLRSLCFHRVEFMLRLTHHPQETRLDPEHIRYLAHTYHKTEWLAFDVGVFHLANSNDSITQNTRIPVPGWSPTELAAIQKQTTNNHGSDLAAYGQALQIPQDQYDRYLQLNPSIQDGEPGHKEASTDQNQESIFQALLLYSSLRHLRLFVYSRLSSHWPCWNISTVDAIYTFLYYRNHKRGSKLESLVIWCYGSGQPSVTIYELGESKVHVSTGPRRQIWDVSDYENVELVERRCASCRDLQNDRTRVKMTDGFFIPEAWRTD